MRKLTPSQRTALQDARQAAVSLQTMLDRLADGIGEACGCEANPKCRVCEVFALVGQLPHDLEAARELIDLHLTNG